MKKFVKYCMIVLAFSPLFAFAQLSNTESLIERGGYLIRQLTIVVAGIALLVFFWGLVKFIIAQGNAEAKTDAKKIMGWGIVALFVMVSVWGLVYFIGNELFPGVGNYNAPPVPVFRDQYSI